jgi:hypothetical protein
MAKQYREFISLHDTVFPNTYYSGKEIIERMSSNQKVYTSGEGSGLKGYLNAEYNLEEQEGSIEFIGVDEKDRYAEMEGNCWIWLSQTFFNHGAVVINLCSGTNK